MSDLLKKTAAALPEYLRGWVERHVDWTLEEKGPARAWVLLKDGRYRIGFDAEFVRVTPHEELQGAWLHEINHILRGDCLMRADTLSSMEITAIEYVINEGLMTSGVKLPQDVVTRKSVSERVGNDPPAYTHGWRYVATWLAANGYGVGNGILDVVMPGENNEQNRAAHARAVMDSPPGVRPAIRGAKGRAANKFDVSPIAVLATQLARLGARGSVPRWKSTWRRPNKVSAYLKGYGQEPLVKVVLAMDVSGSMTEFLPTYYELRDELLALCRVETWAWADEAAPWEGEEDLPEVGEGTSLLPLLAATVGEQSLVVVFTDGQVADPEEARAFAEENDMQIVWALIPGYQAPWPGAGSITLERIRG